jgi:protease-4
VVEALREAAEDSSLSAIILRVDSPGGSGPAAEAVWRAVAEAARSKPVVASFSDLAASAAYYVASAASGIVAQPATLTGSIGVFVMRPSFPDLLAKLGIGHEALLRGEHADLLAFTRPLSPETRARFRDDIERAYDRFVARVAEGRAMSEEEVDLVARGRVWTGEQAVPRKLVDALGGLRTAMAEAKRLAKIDAEADVLLRPLPGPKPLAAELREMMGMSLRAAAGPQAPVLEPLRELVAWLAEAGAGAPVLVPPVWIDIR